MWASSKRCGSTLGVVPADVEGAACAIAVLDVVDFAVATAAVGGGVGGAPAAAAVVIFEEDGGGALNAWTAEVEACDGEAACAEAGVKVAGATAPGVGKADGTCCQE